MQGHVSFPDFEDTLRQLVREEIARSRPPEQPSGYFNVESAAAYLDTTPGAYVFGGKIVRELPRLIVGVAQPFSKRKGDFGHPGMMSGFVSGLTDHGCPTRL